MTPQEAFDKVVRGLASQGWRQSTSTLRPAYCAYNGKDGCHCAVGWLIEGIKLTTADEVQPVAKLLEDNSEVRERLGGLTREFLTALQRVHDKSTSAIFDEKNIATRMQRLARYFADDRGLSTAVLDEVASCSPATT